MTSAEPTLSTLCVLHFNKKTGSEALRDGIITFGPTNLEKIEAVYTKVADAEEHLEKLNTLLRGSSNLSSRSGKVSSAIARRR